MIISHSKKFVLLRPLKCAGTSVQLNLQKYADVVSQETYYDPLVDSFKYKSEENHLDTHSLPDSIQEKDYYWITLVRNPYDAQVSYNAHLSLTNPETLETTIKEHCLDNSIFYQKYDYIIRYEHLEEDYKKLCEILNITYEPLPKTKDKIRKDKGYEHLYTPELEQIVYDTCKPIFDTFGYERIQFVSGQIPATA